jgi:hypothetical protein
VSLDPVNIVPWSADWLWSLPLSVVTVVLHVVGLFVMAGTTVSVTLLHGLESAIWAIGFRLLHALPDKKSAMLYSVSAMTTFGHSGSTLEPHWQLMGALEALNGLILFGLSTAFLYGILQEAWVRLGYKGMFKAVV